MDGRGEPEQRKSAQQERHRVPKKRPPAQGCAQSLSFETQGRRREDAEKPAEYGQARNFAEHRLRTSDVLVVGYRIAMSVHCRNEYRWLLQPARKRPEMIVYSNG